MVRIGFVSPSEALEGRPKTYRRLLVKIVLRRLAGRDGFGSVHFALIAFLALTPR
jgi:hypothetical protein